MFACKATCTASSTWQKEILVEDSGLWSLPCEKSRSKSISSPRHPQPPFIKIHTTNSGRYFDASDRFTGVFSDSGRPWTMRIPRTSLLVWMSHVSWVKKELAEPLSRNLPAYRSFFGLSVDWLTLTSFSCQLDKFFPRKIIILFGHL